MAPNTCKFESIDTFATIDKKALLNGKSLFTSKLTPLLSDEEIASSAQEQSFSGNYFESKLLADAQRRESEKTELTTSTNIKNDYWDWCNDESALERRQRENKKILEWVFQEEATREYFSVEALEKRLVESSKKNAKQTDEKVAGVVDQEYWGWNSGQDLPVTSLEKNVAPQGGKVSQEPTESRNYWGWHNDETPLERQHEEHKNLIANLLLEEDIRMTFSVDTLEKRLLSEAKRQSEEIEENITQEESKDDGYWGW